MAEKLLKAFENMKIFNVTDISDDSLSIPSKLGSKLKDAPLTKKEKIQNTNVITDCLTSVQLRSSPDFPKFLSVTIELMLSLCDDVESDIRIVADECLNKIIKSLTETHISRIQVELYKEIKKNGSSRCLKTAMNKFGNLCHYIRPQKCRPYLVNILPCLSRISQRKDEAIQECLLSFMQNISPVLIPYTTDLEIKMLMKTFLANMTSSSPSTRRTAGQSLVLICMHSNNTYSSLAWLLQQLIDDLSKDNSDGTCINGWLLTLRHLLSHPIISLDEDDDEEEDGDARSIHHHPPISPHQHVSFSKLLTRVLELILKYSGHVDHNVVNTSLECLLQYLKHLPTSVRRALVSLAGLQQLMSAATDPPMSEGMRQEGTIENPAHDRAVVVEELLDPQTDILISESINDQSVDDFNNLVTRSCSDSSMSCDVMEAERNAANPTPASNQPTTDDNITKDDNDVNVVDTSSSHVVDETNLAVHIPCEVGTLYDDNDVPLLHVARLICREFLLTGQKGGLLDDFKVRVSVKVISISCLTRVIEMYPRVLVECLSKNGSCESGQCMDDVLMYRTHPDPHMKGNIGLLIGAFVSSILTTPSTRSFHQFVGDLRTSEGNLQLEKLLEMLMDIFDNESSIATRCSLKALQSCLPILINSCHGDVVMTTLLHVLHIRSNSYWLVKVELLNLITVLDYKNILYLQLMYNSSSSSSSPSLHPQQCNMYDKVFDILMMLLGDDDVRVREAATSSICRIINRYFHYVDGSHGDLMTSHTRHLMCEHMTPRSDVYAGDVQGRVRSTMDESMLNEDIHSSLSRIIKKISMHLHYSSNKQLTLGCCNALLKLSQYFPINQHMHSWLVLFTNSSSNRELTSNIHKHKHVGQQMNSTLLKSMSTAMNLSPGDDWMTTSVAGLLPFILSNITSSSLTHDINFHADAIRLAGNIFIGLAKCNLSRLKSDTESLWMILNDRYLAQLAEQLFVHLMRVMNMFHLIINNGTIPTTTPSLKSPSPVSSVVTSSSSLSSSSMVSPLKRKMKMMKEDAASNQQDKTQQAGVQTSTKEVLTTTKESLGTFTNIHHYQQFHNVLKISYASYKISPDFNGDKFCVILQSTLHVMSQLLEMSCHVEVGRCAEEMLTYLAATFSIDPTITLICTQQLLRSLFGNNLTNVSELVDKSPSTSTSPTTTPTRTTMKSDKLDVFKVCYVDPYERMDRDMNKMVHMMNDPPDKLVQAFRKFGGSHQTSAVNKLLQKYDKTSVATFIKLFEPLVIRALKQYTTTSMVPLQVQVLQLLINLIKLRVNYYLLDSDQIFIGFIMKQFEQIESGQIKDAHVLLNEIINFLTHLSMERYHSKSVISMPKIIQLCDGIMASGLDPAKFCIPCMQHITRNLFACRHDNVVGGGGSDVTPQDVETQREVVISMLLRILHHCKVIDMFNLILMHAQLEGVEKWNKTSRQLADVIFPLISRGQIPIKTMEDVTSLNKLMLNMSSCVYRPAHILLTVLFSSHISLKNKSDVTKWLMKLMCCLKVLMSYLSEDDLVLKICDMNLTWLVQSPLINSSSTYLKDQNMLLPRLFTDAMLVSMHHLLQTSHHPPHHLTHNHTTHQHHKHTEEVLSHLTYDLLTYIVHSITSGALKSVGMKMLVLLRDVNYVGLVDVINNNIIHFALHHPAICIRWTHLMLLMKFILYQQSTQQLQPQQLDQPMQQQLDQLKQHEHTFKDLILNKLFNMEDCFPVQHHQQHHQQQHIPFNQLLVQHAVFTLLCEHAFAIDNEKLVVWLVEKNINRLIEFNSSCEVVHSFIRCLHGSRSTSQLLCDSIVLHYKLDTKIQRQPHKIHDMLACLDDMHPTLVGHMTDQLITTMLPHVCLNVSRMVDKLSCKLIEMMLSITSQECMELIGKQEVGQLILHLDVHCAHMHEHLKGLLVKLKMHLMKDAGSKEDEDAESSSRDRVNVGQMMSADCIINQDAVMKMMMSECCMDAYRRDECGLLLATLNHSSISSIMSSKEFNPIVLKSCFDLLTTHKKHIHPPRMTSQPMTSPHLKSSYKTCQHMVELHILATKFLHDHIQLIVKKLPVPHQLLLLNGTTTDHHTTNMLMLFNDANFNKSVMCISEVLTSYFDMVVVSGQQHKADDDGVDDEDGIRLCRFIVLCSELTHYKLYVGRGGSMRWSEVVRMFTLLNHMFSMERFNKHLRLLNNVNNTSLVVSIIYHVYYILQFKVFHLDYKCLQEKMRVYNDMQHLDEMSRLKFVCKMVCEMSQHLSTDLNNNHKFLLMMNHSNIPSYVHLHSFIPPFACSPLKQLIINLSRLPLVNSYTRTPEQVWKLGWSPVATGQLNTTYPPVPFNYLREKEVLMEYICRVNSIGWTSRQQFEETWMSFLGVLNPSLYNEPQSSPEDTNENVQYQMLAMRSITCLLLLSSLTPHPGNLATSEFIHTSRNQLSSFFKTKIGLKLLYIRYQLENEWRDLMRPHVMLCGGGGRGRLQAGCLPFTRNIERVDGEAYLPGQLSISWICSILQEVDDVTSTQNILSTTDTHLPSTSDSSTVVDMGVTSADTNTTDMASDHGGDDDDECNKITRAYFEDVYSFVSSDVWKDRSLDINSCLQLLLDLYGTFITSHLSSSSPFSSKVHLNLLIETIRSLLLLSDVFVSASQYDLMLMSMMDIYKSHPLEDELLMSYVVLAVCKAAAVQGMETSLMLKVQKIIDSSLRSTHLPTKISTLHGGLYLLERCNHDNACLIVPVYVDYLLKSLSNFSPSIIYSQQHVLVMLSVSFLILERYFNIIKDTEFNENFIKLCFNMVSIYEDAIPLPLYESVMLGLERLVVCEAFNIIDLEALMKLAIERFSQQNTQRSLIAFNVLITCMYRDLEKTLSMVSGDGVESSDVMREGGVGGVQTMERVTIIFDRMRKGLPNEACIVVNVLSHILFDFFEPHEIMNKIIGEFLYSQHPHAHLFAQLLFKVFEQLIRTNQSQLIINWVMLSLSNFTQITPLSTAIWSLTCIFICSSRNPLIRALFPLVLQRLGHLESFDLEMFRSSGVDFHKQLSITDQSLVHSFIAVIQSMSHDKLPYNLLLQSINH